MLLVLVLLAALAAPASSAAQSTAEQQLAERYSPIVAVESQPQQCGDGEAYRPTLVDLVLKNPEVLLRNSSGDVVKRGPTAGDLMNASTSHYIDMPGDPVKPGCGYEKDYRRWNDDRKPAVYAHVATDSDHPGKLAVQYWFYYTFNDFTDKHESDWEMAQVNFNGATPDEALKNGPYEFDLAQHAGGERANWNDSKVTKQGTHPLAFVATGSHADYFESELYLGKGASTGFGCDDARDVDQRLPLQTVLLPNGPQSADSQFAWLMWGGRWGQKEKGLNNGPTGPSTKSSWAHPITWSEGLRDNSLVVPGGGTLGVSVTGFFCGAVTNGSKVLNWADIHPWSFLTLAGVIVALVAYMARRTTWRPFDTSPVRSVRGGGQILRSSRRLYREHLRTFIGIGVIFIPVAMATAGLQWVLFHLTGLEDFVKIDGGHGLATVLLALLIGGIGATLAAAAVTSAVSAALNEIDARRGSRPSAPTGSRGGTGPPSRAGRHTSSSSRSCSC
jgi:hypothetical protein